ncbi:nitric oxide reductase, partial [mine drainage metagenome]
HGYAYARSMKFYDTTLFWQWMRMPGDIVFAAGAVLMAWDFMRKLWMQRQFARAGMATAAIALVGRDR